MRILLRNSTPLVLLLVIALSVGLLGCSTKGETGALTGAGVGALVGQAIGRNTPATLFGAALGAGVGFVIGNELDKADAQKIAKKEMPLDTGSFGGTRWKAVSINPPANPPYKSYIVEFGNDGFVTSTETFMDGTSKTSKEHYRVKGDILIINSPGYIINATYKFKDNQVSIDCDKFNAVFQRI